MKAFGEKKPILAGITAAAMFIAGIQIIDLAVMYLIPYDGSYFSSMIAELFYALLVVGIAALFGRLKLFGKGRLGFFSSLKPCLILLGMLALNLGMILGQNFGKELNSAYHIITFLVTMLLIGFAEEALFRGVIAGMIFDKYGKDRAGVWYSALISGVIFGLGHISNVFSGVQFSGVLVQAVLAIAIGMVYTAIYYRTGNIWVMMLLHAINDIVALLETGFFAEAGSMTEIVSSYSVEAYGSIVAYTGLMFLILRPGKLLTDVFGGERACLDSSEQSVRRMLKLICSISIFVICCIIYGVAVKFI